MRLRRLYLAAPWHAGARLTLPPPAARHLTRVLRLRSGDPLSVFDGAGCERAARIAVVSGARVEIELGAALDPAPESRLAITLVQGVSRSERMDYAIQKATELGVARIVPVFTARSVVKLDARQSAARFEHWRGVAIGACEQCGRATVPALEAPRPLPDYLAERARRPSGAVGVVLLPEATSGPAALPRPLAAVELLIGPEGGLEDAEAALARATGFAGLRLGPRILRTETAAAAAIAALQALFGDLG